MLILLKHKPINSKIRETDSETEAASTLESTNRSGSGVTPPTTLNLRSSHNQQLSRDIIKEGVVSVAAETQGSGPPPKSRHKYATTNLQSSASSSSLYSSSCVALSLSLSTSNPKLAKNGTNLQLKETQQDLNKKDKNRNDVGDWPDKEKSAPFRRRTKSFLEYHREEDEETSNSPAEKQPESPVHEVEKPLLPQLEPQAWVKENRVEVHLTLPQNHLLLLPGEDEDQSPPDSHLSQREGLHPSKEQLNRAKDTAGEDMGSPARPRLQVLSGLGQRLERVGGADQAGEAGGGGGGGGGGRLQLDDSVSGESVHRDAAGDG
uniref:Uncharacterized protein n=1 Tax=Astyanax mexicanus TaxID=7994 RepID=A0A3B1K7B5_ASTMX